MEETAWEGTAAGGKARRGGGNQDISRDTPEKQALPKSRTSGSLFHSALAQL